MKEAPPKWFGPLFIVAAVPMFFAEFGGGAPGWIGMSVPALFALAGLSFVFASFGRADIGRWLGLCTLLAFLVPINYAGFGPGPRPCSTSVSIAGYGVMQDDADCRRWFRIGAIVVNVLAFIIVWKNYIRVEERRAKQAR